MSSGRRLEEAGGTCKHTYPPTNAEWTTKLNSSGGRANRPPLEVFALFSCNKMMIALGPRSEGGAFVKSEGGAFVVVGRDRKSVV